MHTSSVDCPFCDPNEEIIRQTEHVKVLLSNPRKVPGHLLVMPKRHIEQPWEMTDAEIREIFQLIFDIEQKLIGKLGQGCDIRQNYRPYVPQGEVKVDHVLFHVIPRSPDDYIYSLSEKFEADLFAALDEKEAEEVSKLVQ